MEVGSMIELIIKWFGGFFGGGGATTNSCEIIGELDYCQ
jgi:hypothetical protein